MLKIVIFFIVFAGTEVAVALKSRRERAVYQGLKFNVRVAEFLVFVCMALTAAIAWGFQWYLAAIFLTTRAIAGLVSKIRRKEQSYSAKGLLFTLENIKQIKGFFQSVSLDLEFSVEHQY